MLPKGTKSSKPRKIDFFEADSVMNVRTAWGLSKRCVENVENVEKT